MSTRRILIFGSEGDMAQPFASKLKLYFSAQGADLNLEAVVRDKMPPPKGDAADFVGAILVWKDADPASLSKWKNWLALQKAPPALVVWTDHALPESVKSLFQPRSVVASTDNPEELLRAFGVVSHQVLDLELSSHTSAGVQIEATAAPSSAFELEPGSQLFSGTPEPVSEEGSVAGPVSAIWDSSAAPANTPSPQVDASALEAALDLDIPSDLPAAPAAAPAPESWSAAPQDVAAPADDFAAVLGAEPGALESAPAAAPASDEESNASVGMDDFMAAPAAPRDTEEYVTLKRYGALKEREVREKEAALGALNRQLEQIRDRLTKSEAERRRLTLAMGEADVLKRSLEDDRDQAKHHVAKVEAAHQEELRALQLRLDNAQFQASRAEKKLEEFRERVRTDIQKIRLRERELANRLELQKRDAEALLAAKDERLLQQKRDIDRLEFEVETLRERLVDQTQKAEDRVSRVSRAFKALKMAQGMLSGMEDEVLPTVEGKSSDEEAA